MKWKPHKHFPDRLRRGYYKCFSVLQDITGPKYTMLGAKYERKSRCRNALTII